MLWIIGSVVIAVMIASYVGRRRQNDRNEQFDLRFPELNSYRPEGDSFRSRGFVDLKEMILIHEARDFNLYTLRTFDLRLLDGPRWEFREQYDSWRRYLAEIEADPVMSEDRKAEERSEPVWRTFSPDDLAPKLEAAYQRYLVRHREMWFDPTPVQFAVGAKQAFDLAHVSRAQAKAEVKPKSA